MEWQEYKQRYWDFIVSVQEADIVALVASKALGRIPESLPAEWRKSVMTHLRKVGEMLLRFTNEVSKANEQGDSHASRPIGESYSFGEDKHADISSATVNLIVFAAMRDKPSLPIDLSAVGYTQFLVMLFAHASAFVADTVRAICIRTPQVLRCNKGMTWNEIVEHSTFDNIINNMTQTFVYDFCLPGLPTILEKLRDRLGLRLSISEEMIQRVHQAELVRNVVVHDGSRVSAEYVKRSGQTGLVLGQRIEIDSDMLKQVRSDLIYIIHDIMIQTSIMHFKVPPEEAKVAIGKVDRKAILSTPSAPATDKRSARPKLPKPKPK